MARGDRREEIFLDDRDRSKFLGYLAEGAERYRVKVHCYVLMANHFHLVVTTPEGNLSKWMHQLKTAYTVYFNRRHQLVGHLFQGRFKSTVIEAESYLLEVSRYLHLNPVRGVVLGQGTPTERRERLRGYLWSSYPGYPGLEKTKPFLDSEAIEGVTLEQMSDQLMPTIKVDRVRSLELMHPLGKIPLRRRCDRMEMQPSIREFSDGAGLLVSMSLETVRRHRASAVSIGGLKDRPIPRSPDLACHMGRVSPGGRRTEEGQLALARRVQ